MIKLKGKEVWWFFFNEQLGFLSRDEGYICNIVHSVNCNMFFLSFWQAFFYMLSAAQTSLNCFRSKMRKGTLWMDLLTDSFQLSHGLGPEVPLTWVKVRLKSIVAFSHKNELHTPCSLTLATTQDKVKSTEIVESLWILSGFCNNSWRL